LAEETALALAGYLYYSGHSPLMVVLALTAGGVFPGDALAVLARTSLEQCRLAMRASVSRKSSA